MHREKETEMQNSLGCLKKKGSIENIFIRFLQ